VDTPIDVLDEEFGWKYEFPEPADLVDLIVATGDWLEMLVGTEFADAAMKTLHRDLMRTAYGNRYEEPEEEVRWRSLFTESFDSFVLPELDEVHKLINLNAFAFWGLPIGRGSVAEREVRIDRRISKARALLDAAPPGWADLRRLKTTVSAAEARLSLDRGDAITPEQLASLAQVKLKSIKNLLAPSSGSDVSLDADGRIAAPVALAWLKGRDGFRCSIWREDLDCVGSEKRPAILEDLGEVVFVPQTRDGSWFDPRTCRRAGCYTIGPKGGEQKVDDYFEAVRRLSGMPVPYWRRPNSAGNWSIVAGTAWIRRRAASLAMD
jgi:hypothetical protein